MPCLTEETKKLLFQEGYHDVCYTEATSTAMLSPLCILKNEKCSTFSRPNKLSNSVQMFFKYIFKDMKQISRLLLLLTLEKRP